MRWIVFGAVILFGAVIALLGRTAGGPNSAESVDLGEGRAVAPDAEAPRLQGHASPSSAPSLVPSPPAAAGDEGVRLRQRLRTADAAGLVKALGEIETRGPSDAALIGDLIRLLEHEDRQVMQAAADALAAMGQVAVEPFLNAVVAEYDRRGAAGAHGSWAMSWGPYVLAKIGEPALIPVAKVLGHKDAYFWANVTFQRLAILGTPMSEATDVVLERLAHAEDESALNFVIGAVPHLGRDAVRAVPKLVDLLGDPRLQVRIEAVQALGRIGPDASLALADLEHLRGEMPEAEGTMRQVLDEAISRIRGER